MNHGANINLNYRVIARAFGTISVIVTRTKVPDEIRALVPCAFQS
jgi:hypothetical protein